MFCPRCRTFTDQKTLADSAAPNTRPTDPARSAEPPQTNGSGKSASPLRFTRPARKQGNYGRCAQCGTLLTLDRMAAEFPERLCDGAPGAAAVPQTTQSGDKIDDSAASAPVSAPDSPMTIREILRETAGPNPISGIGQLPLDQRRPGVGADRRGDGNSGGRRKDDIPLSGSRYNASETAQRRNRERKQRELDADWRHSDSPTIPRGYGSGRWKRPNVEIVLGMATVGAVGLLVISMTLRIILASNGVPAPAPHPKATVVNASTLGYPPVNTPINSNRVAANRGPSDDFAEVPASVSGEWRRVGQPINISVSGSIAQNVDVAAYEPSGPKGPARISPIKVWVQHLKSNADATACLTLLIDRREALEAAETGIRDAVVRWETIGRVKTAVFDQPTATQLLAGYPGEMALGSLRAWQQGSDVITVGADDGVTRDNFARDYLSPS